MPQESQPQHFQPDDKQGLMARLFGHHPYQDEDEEYHEHQSEAQNQETKKKEREMDKFSDYLGDDEQLEEEGKSYGGLI